MTTLTATQQAFIEMMSRSEYLERKGYQLLLQQRADYAHFFDVLKEAGFFAPAKNPAPAPGERENTIWIPFWAPLDYFKAVARKAGEENDLELAAKIMRVVRDVSAWRDEAGRPRQNYHTNRIFAEILGLVPTAAVSLDDIDLIAEWLNDPYDHMLVLVALDKGALSRFLDSADAEDRKKAVRVLDRVTAITWQDRGGEREPEPRSVADDYALGELLQHHAKQSGRRTGTAATEVLLGRVREVFSTPTRRDYSSVFRPAVGDDAQNCRFRSVENRSVEGLRDVLLGWSEEDPSASCVRVKQMIRDDLQILRRVGLYVLAECWATMSGLYDEVVAPEFFGEHTHELYRLLKDRFAEMSAEAQTRTLTAIEELPKSAGDDRDDDLRRYAQFRWFSAIVGKGCAAADRRFAEIGADPKVGKLGEHPDFDTYVTGWVSPGPSPYSKDELTALTHAGAVADKLAAFSPRGDWSGSTSNGLSSALEDAARTAPDVFLLNLAQFRSTKPVYQHAVVGGLKAAWEAKTGADWREGWKHLLSFFEGLTGGGRLQVQAEDGTYNRWVVAAIADFLRAGTIDDNHAYDPELLPRSQGIITHLLESESGVASPAEDAMTQALNSTKGRVIEALYSHALRAARVSYKEKRGHDGVWHAICPIFEAELKKCANANYEFSTFAGAYLPQLQYLDAEWTRRCVEHIFPVSYEANTVCALDGLSYAAFTRPSYELLTACGVIDRALGLELKGRAARGKLVERIGAAYLWGIEPLAGERFAKLFQTATADDLEVVVRLFWMLRDGDVSSEQRQRILAFWERELDWSSKQPHVSAQSLSSSSLLAVYITELGTRERWLLEEVAPHLHADYEGYEFIAQLLRLAPQDPEAVSEVLESMISARAPDYDYEDRLRKLLELLAEHGQRERVIRMCGGRLHQLPGIKTLFDNLTGHSRS